MPLTMTAEREATNRSNLDREADNAVTIALETFAELHAERAAHQETHKENEERKSLNYEAVKMLKSAKEAHKETQAKLDAWLALGAETPHGLSVVMDAACAMAKLREQKLVETQTRLAATLAHFDNMFNAEMHSTLGLLERDSAMKQEVRSIKTQLAETQAIMRELLRVLEPFAEWAERMKGPNALGDSCPLSVEPTALRGTPTIGDVRKAASVYTKAKAVLPPC